MHAVSGPADPAGDGGSVRFRLDLGYDGTQFSGWARQPGRRTVQGVLEEALHTLTRTPVEVRVAGRTDAGVHAAGQVAHVDVPAGRQHLVVPRRLNGLLPPDVRVRTAAQAPDGFDARFSALARRYAYRICDEPAELHPLRRWDTVPHPRRLDIDLMREASGRLLGEHDFAAFCKPREGATTVRRLLEFGWQRDGNLVTAAVRADAFCHSMVRALVGALLAVGDGRRPGNWPREVLVSRRRDLGVTVAPARGLTLVEVRYPPDAELRARADQTRRLRQPPPNLPA